MFKKTIYLISSIIFIVFSSCSEDPKSSNDTIDTVTDIDGNVYRTTKIGTQVWMTENLKVTHYRNGNEVSNIQDSTIWAGYSMGAFCIYNNDSNNLILYGNLYNWYAVSDSQNIAPDGWHVPSDTEWQILSDFLGGDSLAGYYIKSDDGWFNNGNGTNSSGFSAFPGGYRTGNGIYQNIGSNARFWSTTINGEIRAWHRRLVYNNSIFESRPGGMKGGYSIRCIKD